MAKLSTESCSTASRDDPAPAQRVREGVQEDVQRQVAAPVAAAAAAAGGGGGGAGAAEEKDEFDVILKAAGDKKIQVIKEVVRRRAWASRRPRTWSTCD